MLKEEFNQFDRNGDGTIDAKELGYVLRVLGHDPTDAELQQFLDEADTNGNGVIDFPEFCAFTTRLGGSFDTEESLLEPFKALDKDKNGVLSVQELRTLMTTHGEPLSEEEAEKFFAEVDVDGDGNVNYFEFIRMIVNS